ALRGIARDDFTYAAPDPAWAGRIDRFAAPRSLAALGAAYAAQPQARLLAGGTDIGLWVNKRFRDVGSMIYLGDVAELSVIEHEGEVLRIGAAAPLEDAWAALVAMVPDLAEMALRFAGPPVRHAGTMGGNVANGSPIGDAAPVLMALDATLVLQCGSEVRRVALDEFYLGYGVNALRAGEFLRAIEVARPDPAMIVRGWKISKRSDCDISALSCGFALRCEAGVVRHIRLAFGGMAAIVRRADHAEAVLREGVWSEARVTAAMAALGDDFAPLSDMRASRQYRLRVARHLLWRIWLETRPERQLPAAAMRVRPGVVASVA
ncbi:FAD binding domain-containing protein, partial [Acidiphilium sp.]|uniref:FAD binding domain-containing protein n=1 Tax=Acidiphilium sp. TaxID=527 RepID=UPI003D06C3F2